MDLQFFKDRMYEVDSLCEVEEHPTILMCLRIRPSHPRYRDKLRNQAQLNRPIGVLISVMKEVDDFIEADFKVKWYKRWFHF
jgi:hypothetical protein